MCVEVILVLYAVNDSIQITLANVFDCLIVDEVCELVILSNFIYSL